MRTVNSPEFLPHIIRLAYTGQEGGWLKLKAEYLFKMGH
jgi:hypothetical protein